MEISLLINTVQTSYDLAYLSIHVVSATQPMFLQEMKGVPPPGGSYQAQVSHPPLWEASSGPDLEEPGR